MPHTASFSFRAAYGAVLERWPGPVTGAALPTPYGTTWVNSAGPADAPPLVLLPGGGATSTVWGAALAAGLARTHRVHAPDLLGDPGLSVPDPARPLRTVAGLHAWLDAVLDGLGHQRVHLAGHSYGAWIAAHYAVRSPHRIDRLALLDPTQVFTGFRPGYLLRALPMLARPTPARIRRFLDWESGGTPLDPHWLRLQEETAGFRSARPVTGPRPRLEVLRESGAPPVLALFAGRSRCHDATRAARAAAAVLPAGAEIGVLPDTGHHGLPLTAAPELARRL
ncbi:alpha/beta fold hydrolase [Streptomyces sp. NPDC012888]|uniref:alpha/beta hydrolase n=1 Tax=Streptomyces sp. NPDC012888 TaxID=3364855 RepID=UPI0036C14983